MNTNSPDLRDYQSFAVLAMDGSGRYGAADNITLAKIYADDHASRRPGVRFIVVRWNGPKWRERGHWQEYSEQTFYSVVK